MDTSDRSQAAYTVDAQQSKGVLIGDHGTIVLNSRPDVAWPVRVGVPPRAADCFQDRAAQADVAQKLTEAGTAVLVPASTAVISGLGGVGKTQIAARHAHRLWSDTSVDVLMWVTATSRDSVLTAYRSAARLLLFGAEDASPEHAAASLLTWCAATDRRWLIVLDDVKDPDDLRELWPPSARNGQVVITTRRRDNALVRTDWHLVEIGVFTAPESAAYLAAKLPAAAGTDEGISELAGLANDLGHLPLALAQAAAFIADKPLLTPTAYRRRLADRRNTLNKVFPDRSLPDDHQRTVAATWSLSVDLADQLSPTGLARPLLEIAALLAPDGIPIDVITSQAVCSYLTQHTKQDIDRETAGDALGCLHRLSLITLDTTQPNRGLRIHALVQRATRDTTPKQHLSQLALTAADALIEAWPDIERDTDLAAALRANTNALRTTAEPHLWNPKSEIGCHPALFQAGHSLGGAGQVTQAISYYEHLQTAAARYLDPDHPNTLSTRGNLAIWRGEAGDAAGAATALEQLLTDRLRVLGPDHPATLSTRGNLAIWRGEAGDAAGAVTALEQLLTDTLRVLGPDHLRTLATRNNLASWRGQAGDTTGAVTALKQLLTDTLRVLGPDHLHTLATRGNLAIWQGEAGDAAGAVTTLEQLLTDTLRVLGPDHLRTLATRGNLAIWRGEAGDAAGAVTAFEQLLADHLRVLGPDHPDTLATRSNLASWRGQAGDTTGAATAFEQLLTDHLRVLGPDHPNTLTTRSNLASWRGQAGDISGAVTALEQLLTDTLRVLGPDHPNTLTIRGNLAHWEKRAASP